MNTKDIDTRYEFLQVLQDPTKGTEAMRASLQGLHEALTCLLCKDLFEDPVTFAACGHSFCRECLHTYASDNWKCPGMCFRGEVSVANVFANRCIFFFFFFFCSPRMRVTFCNAGKRKLLSNWLCLTYEHGLLYDNLQIPPTSKTVLVERRGRDNSATADNNCSQSRRWGHWFDGGCEWPHYGLR